MRERDRIVVTGLVIFILLLWLGFLAPRAPRFPGSLIGGVFGVSGALLMMVPLWYSMVKRIGPLHIAVTRSMPMRTLLSWHIYAGILGPVLALLHTGHKFDNPVAVALTAMMLVEVFSGFTGRYLLGQISDGVRDQKNMQAALYQRYQEAAAEIARRPEWASAVAAFSRPWLRASLLSPATATVPGVNPYVRAIDLVESISDLDYTIRTHEVLKSWFGRWLKVHISFSVVMYSLLILHIWSEVHFGIRWFHD